MTVIFKNEGILDAHGLMTFGLCAKETKNPIGYFGTGLKFALAVLMREGAKVRIHRGLVSNSVRCEPTIVRGQDFAMVYLGENRLPFTTDLGKDWELWMAYRELYANTVDEGGTIGRAADIGFDHLSVKDLLPEEGHTVIAVDHPEFDEIHTDGNIFLTSEPTYTFKDVEYHEAGSDVGAWLYVNGIRAKKLDKRAMYNYNITKPVKLTEDRTVAAMHTVYAPIANALLTSDNEALIRRTVEANQEQWESTIDWYWASKDPGESFHKVIQDLKNRRKSFSSSVGSYYGGYDTTTPAPEIVDMLDIPLKERHKLRAARMFWEKLGIDLGDRKLFVAADLGKKRGKIHKGDIYIDRRILSKDMRVVCSTLYRYYLKDTYKGLETSETDILADTLVDFGERILGLNLPVIRNDLEYPLPTMDSDKLAEDEIPF